MTREQSTPFFLWITAALVAHLAWSGGAEVVSRVVYELGQVRAFARQVREDTAATEPIEVAVESLPQPPPDPEPTSKPEPPKAPPEDKKKKPEPPKVEPPKPEPPKAAEAPKPAPPKPILLVPAPPAPPPPPPPPPVEIKKDQRIAVKQHVKDKNQRDNPNAHFVGDEANHVAEEKVSRNTSHDRDDPNPTMGGSHAGPAREPGNSDRDRVGSSEDRAGDPDKAPGEASKDRAAEPKDKPAPAPATAEPKPAGGGPTAQPAPRAPPPDRAQPQPAPADDPGAWALDPRRKVPAPAGSADPRRRDIDRIAPRLGLGAGPNERGVQLNLGVRDIEPVVGVDNLRKQRESDGERRRSAKRGSWQSSTFERWRPAIENYVSSVKTGNQTALNTARVPFATYLVSIHNRIHPIFADGFLESLDALPGGHGLNDYNLITRLEIVLDRDQGRVVKMGVVKTSGITSFDVAALDSVHRAQPFGKPPDAIVSRDGNVYLHWEFHRNPIYACSTMNARPFMLDRPPAIEPARPPGKPPAPPSDPKERGVPPPGAPPAREDRNRFGSTVPLGTRHGG